jgi:hypothetical protein
MADNVNTTFQLIFGCFGNPFQLASIVKMKMGNGLESGSVLTELITNNTYFLAVL